MEQSEELTDKIHDEKGSTGRGIIDLIIGTGFTAAGILDTVLGTMHLEDGNYTVASLSYVTAIILYGLGASHYFKAGRERSE